MGKKITWKRGAIATVMMAVVASGAFAAWMLFWQDDTNVEIISDGSMQITQTMFFDDFQMNTTLTAQSNSTTATITNNDGPMNFTVGINESIIDAEDSCDNTGDLNITVMFDGAEVVDSQTVEVGSGSHNVTVNVDAVKFACPQNASVAVSLTGQ